MVDIKTLTTSELEQDLLDSLNDIQACKLALIHGVLSYSGGSVQERLDKNKQIAKMISAELERRKLIDFSAEMSSNKEAGG